MIKSYTRLFILLSLIISLHYSSESQWNFAGNPVGGGYQRTLCFANIGTNYFVGTNGAGVFISKDNADTWTPISETLTSKNISAMVALSSYLIIGTQDGVYLTSDNGSSWLPVNDGLETKNVTSFIFLGQKLIVGTIGGIYTFNIPTTSWTSIGESLTLKTISSLAVIGNTLFAGTYGTGVVRTTDNGTTWEQVNNGLPENSIWSITSSGSNLFAAVMVNGFLEIYASTNDGGNWHLANNGLPQIQSLTFLSSGDNVLAGTSNGLFITFDNGSNWVDANEGLGSSRYVFSVGLMNDIAYIGLGDGTIRKRAANQIITSVINEQAYQNSYECRLQNFPNPCKDYTTISFFHPSYEYVVVNLYDATGLKVKEIIANYLPAGEYSVEVSLNSFTDGKYILQLNTGSMVDSKLITLVK